MTRPAALAAELGVAGVTLRNWLRATYPRDLEQRGTSWLLTDDQVASARAEFANRPERVAAIAPTMERSSVASAVPPVEIGGHSDWFWEERVQAALVRYLIAS